MFAGLLSFAFTLSHLCHAQGVPVSFSWQIPEPEISLHEPVILRLSVTNNSSDVANLDLGADFAQGLLVTIITPDGRTIATPPFEPNGITRMGKARIQPGADYVHEFIMDRWYDFESVGTYEIRVKLRYPLLIGNRSVPPPGEASKAILIKARDESALYRRCAALADRASDPRAGEKGPDAAEILSYVRDPVAVPFLVRLADSPSLFLLVQSKALVGLARSSSPEAIDALISVANGTGDDITRPWARRVLLGTARKTQDVKLREHIYGALGEQQPR
jgi:hypothetical protein